MPGIPGPPPSTQNSSQYLDCFGVGPSKSGVVCIPLVIMCSFSILEFLLCNQTNNHNVRKRRSASAARVPFYQDYMEEDSDHTDTAYDENTKFRDVHGNSHYYIFFEEQDD
uniref:Uncharacterized protein n=1 Tax=Sphaerodactylus townsendi TaxID=933632 RepID=A0ACB8G4T1_9SAUR